MMKRAFTQRDLLASISMLVVAAALLMAALGESRRNGRLDEDLASLNRFAVATGSYAADNDDALWSFSWKGGETYLMMDINGDLVPTQMPADDVGAGSRQAVHLLRSIGGRIGENGMPIINGWVPHVSFSHLPLLDYLDEDPLARWTTSVADDVKQNWKDDPINKFDQGEWLPLQPSPSAINRRWPYTAGFQLSVAAWDYNQSELGEEFEGTRVQQAGSHNFYTIPASVQVGDRTLSDVAFAASKAHVYDTHQRHFGSREHYVGVKSGADDGPAPARVPVLMFDGAASVRATVDSNPGWRPNTPEFACMTFFYQPEAWEPATTNGQFNQFCNGFFRWTRGGLKGIDFGALPLDTGQSDPGSCDL